MNTLSVSGPENTFGERETIGRLPLISPQRTSFLLAALFVAWCCGVSTGLYMLWNYAHTPGERLEPPRVWPSDCGLRRTGNRPTLLLFAHPKCPCTQATLGELERLMARAFGRMNVYVLFIKPTQVNDGWHRTSLWRTAQAIPGVQVVIDDQAIETERFGARTSGLVLVYGITGRLDFQGGITLSRGHRGDNVGRLAVEALVENRDPTVRRSPVYGCPL